MEPGSNGPARAGLLPGSGEATLSGLGTAAAGRRPATPPMVILADPAWRRLVRGAERIAARAAVAAGGAGTVVLSSDREVKRLNGRHRGKYKPTNVLTFDFAGAAGSAEAGHGFLGGDIVLALGTVRREARAARRPAAHHLAHLVVHGALHLRGHDHHEAGEARRMEMAEARILARLHVPNPWKRR